MSETPGDIEHALRRVIALGEHGGAGPAHGLSKSRRAIVDALLAAPGALSLDDLAHRVGLHVNTTRHHLDVLVAAGLAERAEGPSVGRGRPRSHYRATDAATTPYTALTAQLDAALASQNEDEVATQTARRWLETAPPVQTAGDLDEAVAAAVDSLRAVGFDARTDEIGDTIVVSDCPYSSLIAEHPMICTVHARLVSSALERTGQPVTLDGFDVWIRPGICRARLSRPDASPAFVASPSTAEPQEQHR